VTIQLKSPSAYADDGELAVQFYTRPDGPPFADIRFARFGGALLTLNSPADCDRLIKAAALAKSMLLGEASEPVTDPLAPLRDAPHFGEAPERTATPAEHADTAARIERAAEAQA
jgi:hypothetical protein